MRRIFLVSLVVALALIVTAPASAGWAGSIYKQSDCTYTADTDSLYCQIQNWTWSDRRTGAVYVQDSICTSGYRMYERTGIWNVTYTYVFDIYRGAAPRWENEITGNEGQPVVEFWTRYRDADKGCT